MRIYLDLNCFNRPFDDQEQKRIHEETEAIFTILSRIVEGVDTFVWSWALSYENARHPFPDRREEITRWERRASMVAPFDQQTERLARGFHDQGISPLDAAHLASAESADADVFLTCDDRLIKQAERIKLRVRLMNPITYLKEVTRRG